jgi:hypothetical protein
LSGTFFYPPIPIFPGENVSLAGDVHVVTHVGPNFIADIHLNMAGVDGIGQTTGDMYIGTGSNKVLAVQLVPNGVPPRPVRANFTLETTNGLASVPLPLTFELMLGSDGTLLPSPSSTVSIGGSTCNSSADALCWLIANNNSFCRVLTSFASCPATDLNNHYLRHGRLQVENAGPGVRLAR